MSLLPCNRPPSLPRPPPPLGPPTPPLARPLPAPVTPCLAMLAGGLVFCRADVLLMDAAPATFLRPHLGESSAGRPRREKSQRRLLPKQDWIRWTGALEGGRTERGRKGFM